MTTPPPPTPAVTIRPERGIQVMTFPPGKMDGHTIRQMYELTVQAIDQPNARLLIDLTGVQQVSSAGLGMFVTLRKKCLGIGSQMHLFVCEPQLLAVFNTMRLELFLPLFTTREDAFNRFKPPAEAE